MEEGSLILHDERNAPLHEPLAGRSCLLIHHLAKHLARKGVCINCLWAFYQCPLTQQSIAQELFQGTQTLLLIELGYLDEKLEGQSSLQHCPSHQ
jgi:hypothetical protein